jgi:BMFP domain-containing protein YqiC
MTRKQQMMIQTRELEALQKRIREAEERLKAQSYHASSAPQTEQSEQDQTTGKDGSL